MSRFACALLVTALLLGSPLPASADAAADVFASNAALLRGDNDEAIRLATAGLNDGTLPAYLRPYAFGIRGLARFRKTQSALAIMDYDSALALGPSNAIVLYNRGLAYARLDDNARAIADYDSAIKLNPRYADAYDDRGLAFVERREFDRASSDLNQAIAIAPKDARHLDSRAWMFYRQGDIEKASLDNARTIELDPNYAVAYEIRAILSVRRGDYDSAIADYERYFRLPHFWNAAYIGLGGAYARLGNFAAAADQYHRAQRYQELAPEGAFALGRLQTYTRDFTKADSSFSYAFRHAAPATDRSYMVIWEFLTAVRAGAKPGASAFPHKSDADVVAHDKWPWPVLELFLGLSGVDRVTGAARNVDPELQREHLCEAYYYSAEYSLALNQTARGVDLLDHARATCPRTAIEFEAAQVRFAEVSS